LGEKYIIKVPHPRNQVGLEGLIRNANPVLLWASLLVFSVTFVITSYRWNELLKALEIHIGQGRTFVLNMVGAFYNTFMPGSTGGDLLKAYYASKQTPHRMRAVMSVVVDRVVGLLALIIVGGVAAGTQWKIPACQKVALASVAICFCVLIGLLVFYNPTLHRISGLDFILRKLPMQRQIRSAVDALHMYGKHPLLGLWALVVSFPVHGAVITSAMFAGMAFGLKLNWAYYWVCVPVIVLAGAIPISPQGAGVMEAFAVLLTRGRGVTVSQAFALTMSIRIVQVLWNLTGGIFVLRGGYHAPGEQEKKELDTDDDPDVVQK
jgi:glycosyltransferase 2 family protein